MVMNIYEYDNYKTFIRDWVENKKALGLKVSFQSLSEKAGVQKAYLSRVLNGDADLNLDQGFLVCEELGLATEEEQYFLLLIEISRSSLKRRRLKLIEKRDELKSFYFKTENHLDGGKLKSFVAKEPDTKAIENYHLNPYHQLVHMALTIDKFRSKPEELRIALSLSEQEFSEIISFLESIGFIMVKGNEVFVVDSGVHLSRSSSQFWPWYQQMMALVHHRGRTQNSTDNLNFTVTFSADSETFSSMKSDVLKLLEKFQKRVQKAPEKELYQMSFDLMNWRL
jgi:uncharacterized protein (TIGR02147 family)